MLKISESSLWASCIHLPVGRMLAGIGAALLLASPSSALAQSKQCPVQFSVSNTTELGALQFDVNYSGASSVGDFATGGCTFVPGGVTDSHVDQATTKLSIGWADTTPFEGPGLFVTCTFVMPSDASANPTAGNFGVSVTDSSNADVPPGPASPTPTIAVAVGTCTNVAPACQNGVLEQGEACDDGNATAGDGCDAACGLSGCPSSPLMGCRLPQAADKSKLSFKNNSDNTKDSGAFQWKAGAATQLADFDTPTAAGSDYDWCVYDGGVLVAGYTVPGGASTWAASGTTGFGFKGDVQGIAQIKMKAGDDGKASISVKGKSKAGNFRSPALPLTVPVVSQFIIDDGVSPLCFQATSTATSKNDAGSFSATGN